MKIDKDKTYVGKWWMWILLLVVVSSGIFGVMRWTGLVGGVVIERKVFEHSFQYQEARKGELAVWQSEMANIDYLLRDSSVSQQDKAVLKARKNALRIKISAAQRGVK